MNEFDSDILTYQIKPPIGGVYSWGAKAWVKKVGTGRTDDILHLNEHYGKNELEALDKARAELKKWLEKNKE